MSSPLSNARIACTIALIALTACSMPHSAGAPVPVPAIRTGSASRSPIPCSQLATIRALHRQMNYVKDAATGDTMEYLVLGDGAVSRDVFVMFPGTGQILTEWPVQMITNSTYSPKIVGTEGYKKSEDGSVSLCHNYRLVLFDYPGIGASPYEAGATRDVVAKDVDNLLADVASKFGISTDLVDPVGWSLGTTYALKYAFLSPASRPERIVHNAFLVGAHPGGSNPSSVGSDSASCVSTLLTDAISATGSLGEQIKGDATKLVFPYEGQTKSDNGTNSGCTATVASGAVSLNVTLECSIANNCTAFIANALESFETFPWRHTKGIDAKVYAQQRAISGDWNDAYCTKAGTNFTSEDCTATGSISQSITNGGICETDTSSPNAPTASNCGRLVLTGKVRVLAGYEDLFIQYAYDGALVDGLNATRAGTADLELYAGAAGHGLMIQHPRWTQAQIQAGM